MALECPSCGYVNVDRAPICGLCGAPLESPEPADSPHHHRVPSGLTPAVGHDTDVGLSGDTTELDALEAADTLVDHEEHRTDVGEAAAHAAATHSSSGSWASSSHRAVPPISDIGEAAGEAAVIPADQRHGAPEPLLGRIKLVVEQGLIIGEQYLLADPEILIGRADQNTQSYPDIDLSGQDNDYVHRIHARLTFHDLHARLSVEHLGGANPTLVNNVPVEPNELVELFIGDRLRVGRVVMRVARI